MEKENLLEIANTVMPFGKYQGRVLIDLPEEYLLWFARKGEFPKGKLGMLMEMTLAIKIEGLDHLVKPLKKADLTGLGPSFFTRAMPARWRWAPPVAPAACADTFSPIPHRSSTAPDGTPSAAAP